MKEQALLNLWQLLDILEQNNFQKSGNNYTMLCPWHNEKTPSLAISTKESFYHCFGCGKHGHLEEIAFPIKGDSKKALKDFDPWASVFEELRSRMVIVEDFSNFRLTGLALLLVRSSAIKQWDIENGRVVFVIDHNQKALISPERIETISKAMSHFYKKPMNVLFEIGSPNDC